MRYILTESEALLIWKKFNFRQVLGLNVNQRIKFGTEKALYKKGIIYSNNDKEELNAEYRALFSNWERMRYSVVRPELDDRDHLQCLLSNERVSMFFSRKKSDITIDVLDFSKEKFDQILVAFAEMEDVNVTETMFNLSLTTEEYKAFIVSETDEEFSGWEKKLGLSAEVLKKYVVNINTKEEAQMLLVEDHVGDSGYMAKVVNTPNGIFMVKHVTRQEEQKMVLVYGSTKYVTDCIYNF